MAALAPIVACYVPSLAAPTPAVDEPVPAPAVADPAPAPAVADPTPAVDAATLAVTAVAAAAPSLVAPVPALAGASAPPPGWAVGIANRPAAACLSAASCTAVSGV